MEQNHYIDQFDNLWGKTTHVLWSRKPNKKAIVFLHGFYGSYDTWKGFPAFLPYEDNLSGYDIFFIQFPSGKTIESNSAILQEELNALFFQSKSVFSRTQLKEIKSRIFDYSNILLVAHSLGAPLVRRTLIRAQRDGEKWLNQTKMLFFAPAHLGEVATGNLVYAAEAIPFQIGKVISRLFLYNKPEIKDLDRAEAGGFLSALIQDTDALLTADKTKNKFLIADQVIGADIERIVRQGTFCSDPNMVFPKMNTTHSSVCKPRIGYKHPIQYLITSLP